MIRFSGIEILLSSLAVFILINGCDKPPQEKTGKILKESFGEFEGGPVDIYTLSNPNNIEVKITNYGGIITSVKTPDKNGSFDDIVLGFDTLKEYVNSNPYFGCIVGRYCNRIGNAEFSIDGHEYKLSKNNGEHSLHGGTRGFDKVIWNAEPIYDKDGHALKLTYLSRDGEEGFPGNLDVTVIYRLTDDNSLVMEYSATTDKTTVVNLTNHSYWNLSGAGSGDVLGHILSINADFFTPAARGMIPTGEIRPVENTPMDFRKPVAIGAGIRSDYEQIKLAYGYDHNWVLNPEAVNGNEAAASAWDPESGRYMEVYTTEPGVQLYSGNFMGGIKGKNGRIYNNNGAFCLETQHYPDSPNRPEFPPVLLQPGETYRTTTIYRFSTR